LGLCTRAFRSLSGWRTSARATAGSAGAALKAEVPLQIGVADQFEKNGSLIETIEALRGDGRSLRPYVIPSLQHVEKWLADNEVFDPEGPEEMFEPFSNRGLLRRFGRK
jgi:hypothetical protein